MLYMWDQRLQKHVQARSYNVAVRRRLPATRIGQTHRVTIESDQGDIDLYIRTGEYEDGTLGEVFVGAGKQGSTLQAMLDGWAEVLSISLQHGVPLETLGEHFIGTRFPPAGVTSDGAICTSLFDCVMKYLIKRYALSTANL